MLLCVGCITWASSQTPDKNNEILPKSPKGLDPVLRRALLKAITDLENETTSPEEDSTTEYDDTTDSSTEDNEILETSDNKNNKNHIDDSENDVIALPQSFKSNNTHSQHNGPVHFQSFAVDGQKTLDNSETLESKEVTELKIENKSILLPTPNTVLETPLRDVIKKDNSNNKGSENLESRNVGSDIEAVSETGSPLVKKTTQKQARIITPTKPTTPKPSHNADGENIEELDEVQVFQAPLVAAFTVHQDINGSPKKVIPIYKQAVREPIVPVAALNSKAKASQNNQKDSIPTQSLVRQSVSNHQDPQISQQYFNPVSVTSQLDQQQLRVLQQQLEHKTIALEEQLRELQKQQKYHEEFLKQQQGIRNQNEQQNIRIQNEQQIIRNQNEQHIRNQNQQQLNQRFQQSGQQQNFVQVQQQNIQHQVIPQQNIPQANSFSISPSISVQATTSNAELLPPQKEAVDFLNQLRSQIPNQLQPPQFNNQLQPPQFNNQQQSPQFNNQQASQFNNQQQSQFNNQQSNQFSNQQNSQGQFQQNSQFPNQQISPFQVQSSISLLPTQQQLPSNRPFLNNFNIPIKHSILQQQLPDEKPFQNNFNSQVQPSGQQQLQLPKESTFLNFNNNPGGQSPSSNRVFRHDSGTGNFGFNRNNGFNNNNYFPFDNNRNFVQQQPRFLDGDKLKSLIYQSGLTSGGKSQEDLSIVSKVLSLNHGFNLNHPRQSFFNQKFNL